MTQKVFHWVVYHTKTVLAISCVLVVLGLLGGRRIKIEVDAHKLLPASDPAVQYDLEQRQRHSIGDTVIVLIDTRKRDGILTNDVLTYVRSLALAIESTPELPPDSVTSLATEKGFHVEAGSLKFRSLLDPLPKDMLGYSTLKGDIQSLAPLIGTIVSRDFSATTVLVDLPSSSGATEELLKQRRAILKHIELCAKLPPHLAKRGLTIHIVGVPIAEAQLGELVLDDIARLAPLCVAVISVLALLFFRNIFIIAHLALKASFAVACTTGIMGFFAIPVDIPTSMLPVLLVATSVSDEVFLVKRFRLLSSRRGNQPDTAIALATLASMLRPASITSLITACGLLGYASSEIRPVARFGLLAAFGVACCLIWSLFITPALFANFGRLYLSKREPNHKVSLLRNFSSWLIQTGLRRRRELRIFLGLTCGILVLGCLRIKVQDNWNLMFSEDSSFNQSTTVADKKLDGTRSLLLFLNWDYLDKSKPISGALLDTAIWQGLRKLEAQLENLPDIGGLVGPVETVESARFVYLGRKAGSRDLPTSSIALLDVINSIDIVRGPRKRSQIIADDFQGCVIRLQTKGIDSQRVLKLRQAVLDTVGGIPELSTARADFGGELEVGLRMIKATVFSQAVSMISALVVAFLFAWLCLKSVHLALVAVIPSAMASVCILGCIGWMGYPFGVAASMISAMCIAIGADFSIYILEEVRHGLHSKGDGEPDAITISDRVLDAVEGTAVTVALVAFGFGVMFLSRIPPNNFMGACVAVGVFVCGGVSILICPSIAEDSSTSGSRYRIRKT